MNLEKEKRAIEYLKNFEPEDEPYYLCYSGGKDSDCIRILAQIAGVKHELHHNLTTVDAPETVRYVKSIPEIIIEKPELTMWQLIEKKLMPPTRIVRYCCSEFKERGGEGRLKITGVRWAESVRRAESVDVVNVIGKPKTMVKQAEKDEIDYRINRAGGLVMNNDDAKTRRFVEHCYRTTSTMVNPIVDWIDDDVWSFLRYYGCQSNPKYQCGECRIGCIGCPMASKKQRKMELAMYPTYKRAYLRAFGKMLQRRSERGLETPEIWKTPEMVMAWWLEDDPFQISLEETEAILDEMGVI
jgi:phosphoadenosine phosphosulfate reductase